MKGAWVGIGWLNSIFCGGYDPGLTTPPIAALWFPPPRRGRGARSSGVGGQRSGVGGQGSEVRGRRSGNTSNPCSPALPSLARRGGPRLSVVGWFGAVRTSRGDLLHDSSPKAVGGIGASPMTRRRCELGRFGEDRRARGVVGVRSSGEGPMLRVGGK